MKIHVSDIRPDDVSLTVSYEKDGREMHLLLTLPDLLRYLVEVELIDRFAEGLDFEDTTVYFFIRETPANPNIPDKYYPSIMSLDEFLRDLHEEQFAMLVNYHENGVLC